MREFTQSAVWQRTLAHRAPGDADPDCNFRARLAASFSLFRDRARELAAAIPEGIRFLTVHDQTHLDALWELADIIIGPGYPLTATEGYVLGGAFLLHDLGMALASYGGGTEELEVNQSWQDAAVQLFRRAHGRSPSTQEMESLAPEIRQEATERFLRVKHAEQAETLATMDFRHRARDIAYYLIADEDLRQNYGPLIGRIGYSHWWPAKVVQERLSTLIGAFPGSPPDWTVDPLKLAVILRAADACHLDARRAPGFARAVRKPAGESEKHWRFQEYVHTPYADNRRLVFNTTRDMPVDDRDAWWLGYELVNLADRELRDADAILRETNKVPFAADGVAGANDPARLKRYFPTKGWEPLPVSLRVSDVAGLVQNLGGQGLYGANPRVPLRELIQNARDAVVGRRVKEARGALGRNHSAVNIVARRRRYRGARHRYGNVGRAPQRPVPGFRNELLEFAVDAPGASGPGIAGFRAAGAVRHRIFLGVHVGQACQGDN